MEKLLFFNIPPDWQYLIYSASWRKKIKTSAILSLTKKQILDKGTAFNTAERKLFNIFCLNLLSKFYQQHYPPKMNNSFINNILRIIDNLQIQITYYQYEVINYWRTVMLARNRNKKNILTTFIDPIPGNKALFKIHNIAIYYDNPKLTKNTEEAKSKLLFGQTITLSCMIANFKNIWKEYKLVKKGTLFFQTQSLVIVNDEFIYGDLNEETVAHSFLFKDISQIIVCNNVINLTMRNKKKFIIVTPYNDCELFATYLSFLKNYLKKNNISCVM